jgi:hypothetical protein
MTDELTRDMFALQLNTQFRVERQDAGAVLLDLVEASAVRSVPGTESFSIVFRGPAGAFLPQAIYQFHHNELGAFDLFIVPICQDARGFYYEAVFNRIGQEGQA